MQPCTTCSKKKSGSIECRPLWVLRKKHPSIQCAACRSGKQACSFTRAKWQIESWPHVSEADQTVARQVADRDRKRVYRGQTTAPVLETARSEGSVPGTRRSRTVRAPARFDDESEVVLAQRSRSGRQRGSGPSTGTKAGQRQLPVSLGDNWKQPSGFVEPVFFQDLDRWSAIVEGKDASFISLREAQSELEALRDDEARVKARFLTRFNARRQVLTMMVETVKEKLARSKMEVVESDNEDGGTVEVLKKTGRAKR